MLLELRVENYALIDNLTIDFAPGLNLLTGETGAGKSILIDALALLLGERASGDVIRFGTEKAIVSAVFDCRGPNVPAILEHYGISSEPDQLILRREVAAAGKGRVFVNNQPATVAVLKVLAPEIAAVHAQNEALASFDSAERLRLLDIFASVEATPIAAAFQEQQAIAERIAELERVDQDRLRMADLWSFQKKEIEDAGLKSGEDVQLESEKRVLANSAKVRMAAMGAHEMLYSSENSASSSVRAALKNLQELAIYDPKFQEAVEALDTARIAIEDVGASLGSYAESIHASPGRLAEIEDRLALLDRLKRKYGASVNAVIAFGEDAARKLNELENRDDALRELKAELAGAEKEFLKLARAASEKRHNSARKLEKLVESEANELAIKARFKVEIGTSEDRSNWSSSGIDKVDYLIATNPGEPLHPLEKIASGGEMSRVMLALKVTIEARKHTPKARSPRTLVFDEVDTGIGGRAAEAVGKKLKALAAVHQILCITHLPQIASFADQHYVIEKAETKEGRVTRTKTMVRRLSPEERTQEIARMLSGTQVSETSIRHAEQMLKAHA